MNAPRRRPAKSENFPTILCHNSVYQKQWLMTDFRSTSPGGGARAGDPDFAAPASGALAAVIEAGARLFITEPWRVARIVRGADAMTVGELCAHVERRRRAGPPTDLNLAIALAQLSLALEAPTFDEIWGARLSSRCEE
jgi:hypothetical protein